MQIKICIILLAVTGCRISELTKLSFKKVETVIKEACIRLWINKDQKTRIIYITNLKFLKKLDKNYSLLKEYCIENNILFSMETFFCFNLKKKNNVMVAYDMDYKSTMPRILNCFYYI